MLALHTWRTFQGQRQFCFIKIILNLMLRFVTYKLMTNYVHIITWPASQIMPLYVLESDFHRQALSMTTYLFCTSISVWWFICFTYFNYRKEIIVGCAVRESLSITIFVNLGLFRHFETITNIRTWIKSHTYWRML